jgi:hypothetical protein
VQGLFPRASEASLQAINALEHQFDSALQASLRPRLYARSVQLGQTVAEAVLAWAATDGIGLFANCPYTPPAGPEFWESTPPAYTSYPSQPCWGQLRPFTLTSGAACAPPPPPAYSEDPASEFYANAFQVYDTNGHAPRALGCHYGPDSQAGWPLPHGGCGRLRAGWHCRGGRLHQLLGYQVHV